MFHTKKNVFPKLLKIIIYENQFLKENNIYYFPKLLKCITLPNISNFNINKNLFPKFLTNLTFYYEIKEVIIKDILPIF